MTAPTLGARDLSLAYDDALIVDRLSLDVPVGQVTVIVGANACGKSTLLRGLCRLLKPKGGTVLLDGHDIHRLPTREVATKLGVLPQQPVAPEGITVADLVGRGRHPHQRWFRQWSPGDERAVDDALEATGVADLADRSMDELSGGQKQRAWIALALAQGTDLMLLDEPTTFLDLAHQVEVLDLLADLNEREGRTIVLVLHDLNLACRYAHHLVAMKAGSIAAQGTPGDVITAELVADVFGLEAQIIDDPLTGTPLVLPLPASQRRRHLTRPREAAASGGPASSSAVDLARLPPPPAPMVSSAPLAPPPPPPLPPPPLARPGTPEEPVAPASEPEPVLDAGTASATGSPDHARSGSGAGWSPPAWSPPEPWSPPSTWESAVPEPSTPPPTPVAGDGDADDREGSPA